MSILVDKNTKVICQGITGNQATLFTEDAIRSGTNMVAGVRPGKGGTTHLALPVFDSVSEARLATDANATVIFVPKTNAASAITEAIDAGINLIVCITEHIPVLDMLTVYKKLKSSNSKLIGPNSPGICTPGECRIGIMPHEIFKTGSIGIVSRSSTLTYEAVAQTTQAGLGQSTCIGIGGDPVHGMSFVDCLELFKDDPQTQAVMLLGEIGGTEEEQTAEYLSLNTYPKQVFAYVAGQYAPVNTRMGHASAIINHGLGTAASKKELLKKAGVIIIESSVNIGPDIKSHLVQPR